MRKRTPLLLSVALTLLSGPFVHAEGQATSMLSEAQMAAIRQNCTSVQSALSRIHTNDVLSRVHLGQEYETISTKFMAPMNSRVALMKQNGIELAKTTVDFNDRLTKFRSQYQQYELALLQPIQMKCTDQPVAFYDALVDARDARVLVKELVNELGGLASQYSAQVKELRAQVIPTGAQVEPTT